MPERRVNVGSKVGLHARPAAMFVQAVSRTIATAIVSTVSGCRNSPRAPTNPAPPGNRSSF